ncbi:MAG TPA: DUF1365 family protein [Rhizomicrobium sp.]
MTFGLTVDSGRLEWGARNLDAMFGQPLLRTFVAGRAASLTGIALLRVLMRNPLYPFKVIGVIHYQVVKLFLKGTRHFGKPVPPTVTIAH